MRIGLRILLGYFLIVALAALLLGRVFLQEVKPGVRQAMEDTLVDTANLLAEQAKDDLLAGRIDTGRFAASVRALADRDPGAEIWGFGKRRIGTRIYITDARGIVVFDSDGHDVGADYSRWNDVYLTLRGRYGARSTRVDPADDASTVMHVAAPIVDRRDGRERIVGVLTVAKPNQTIAPFIARSQDTILRWGFVLLGAALAIGALASWWLSRQLGVLHRYAVAVTAGERASPPDAPGEFGDLGRALATMRERLEGKQYVERYVHALTHEMKSPLAAIRGSAELVEAGGEAMPAEDRRRFVATIRAQGDRLAEMIDKLLALAAVEHRQQIEQPEPVDLPKLIDEATAQLTAKLAGRGLRVQVEAPSTAVVQGDPFLLRQSMVNLLDNAADFAPSGSTVEVSVSRGGAHWMVTVADRGPGVPAYALARTFERFYSLPRPDGGSRSSGLGLCFVAEVATLHGGEATLANREGGGAVAQLALPA
ncbi:MAG TPA: two-component system sensor histidine kinase CreC [Steroidobacteraceae bacterium]|nr:two-component system sensor histidine kinase CreC [Steroidobacteraceae bacterium]